MKSRINATTEINIYLLTYTLKKPFTMCTTTKDAAPSSPQFLFVILSL